MTPAEGAVLLGVAEGATEADIHRAFVQRVATVPESDTAAVDAMTQARDALLAATRWQPPAPTGGNPSEAGYALQPGFGAQPGYPSQPGLGSSPGSPSQPGFGAPPGYPPQSGFGSQPGYVGSQPATAPQPGFPPPPGYAPQSGYPSQPGFGSQPAFASPPGYPPPPGYAPQAGSRPPRKPLSSGAIIGIALGSTAVLLVTLLLAVFAVAVGGQRAGMNVEPLHTSVAAPSASPDDPGAYAIDGVTIQPGEGWTFILTSQRDCPGAEVIVGFADTVDGESVDQLTETVTLQAGVPYAYTVPDTASAHEYAGIDDIECIPT